MVEAIKQTCHARGENHEWAVLKKLFWELDLEGLFIRAAALHTQYCCCSMQRISRCDASRRVSPVGGSITETLVNLLDCP
jgi:hypothetical protein